MTKSILNCKMAQAQARLCTPIKHVVGVEEAAEEEAAVAAEEAAVDVTEFHKTERGK